MRCPMTYGNPAIDGAYGTCSKDCAWLIESADKKTCVINVIAAGIIHPMTIKVKGIEERDA